jgi:phage tail sheath gpL-like
VAVSFSHIPSNIRVPLFYAEISNELAGHLSMQQPALIVGPVTDESEAELHRPVLVTSTSMAYETFGVGSVLADMVNTYRLNDTFGELWAIPVAAGTAAAPAVGGYILRGVAEASGTLPLYVGGDLYRIGVAAGAAPAAIAETLAATIGDDPFALVGARAGDEISLSGVPPEGSAALELTAKQAGELGNAIRLDVAWRGLAAGESIPRGLSIDVVPMSGGAGIPDLTPGLAAMGDDTYDYCAIPWTDAASLDAIEGAMNDVTGRWAWDRQVYGHVFAARMGTVEELAAFGPTRNDQHVSLLGFAPSPSPPWRRAAALTAQAASSLRIDPARPLQTLPLLGVLAPDRGEKFTISQRNTLLFRGIAVEDEVGGAVRINRCATTYQRNDWGQPDPSYLDVTTLATLQYFVRFLRQRILQKFPRHKLADDGTAFGPGQAIVTPRIIKAELVAAYLELVASGIVENVESFKDLLIVERDAQDPNRINVLASPDLINQLRVLGVLVAFRLRTSAQPAAIAA